MSFRWCNQKNIHTIFVLFFVSFWVVIMLKNGVSAMVGIHVTCTERYGGSAPLKWWKKRLWTCTEWGILLGASGVLLTVVWHDHALIFFFSRQAMWHYSGSFARVQSVFCATEGWLGMSDVCPLSGIRGVSWIPFSISSLAISVFSFFLLMVLSLDFFPRRFLNCFC